MYAKEMVVFVSFGISVALSRLILVMLMALDGNTNSFYLRDT